MKKFHLSLNSWQFFVIVICLLVAIWGITDLYDYFSVGPGVLAYYPDSTVIADLVRKNLVDGVIKIVSGLVVCGLILAGNFKKTT